MSLLFAREGAKVVCAARSAALVGETAALIRASGGDAVALVADAGLEDGARSIVAAGVTAFGRVDTLVNNAGDGGPTKPVQDYTVDDWFYTVNSCLTSAYLCSRFAVPAMVAAGRGAIVNIASMAGRRGPRPGSPSAPGIRRSRAPVTGPSGPGPVADARRYR
jgi:NAD(P)-dependent dehydrogenase (short-subunit alcohol dehydrogenase family)